MKNKFFLVLGFWFFVSDVSEMVFSHFGSCYLA